jgi:hypothetical protein
MFDLDAYLAKLGSAADDLALRHRPCPFGLALADSIDHLRDSDWDRVAADRFFMSRDYLRAIERAKPPRMSFRYAICYDGRTPVAAAAYQVLDIALDAFGSRTPIEKPKTFGQALRHVRNQVRDKVGGAIGDGGAPRLLINGNGLVTGEHGFAIAPGTDAKAAMHGLAEATYRIRRAEKLHGAVGSVLIKDFGEATRTLSDELLRFGYHAFEVDPNMVVEIDPAWRKFDDYLGAFTAKYRRKVKDAKKKSKTLVCERLDRAAIEREAASLHALYLAVHEKAHFRLANPGPDYFPALAEALGDDLVIRRWTLDGTPVGCSVALGRGTQLEAHMVGLDYRVSNDHGVYTSALYDFVADAIQRRASVLSMGRTALEIKSSIGAVARPMTCYLRHGNPVGNRLIAPLVAQLSPTPWTPRSPFKDAPDEPANT